MNKVLYLLLPYHGYRKFEKNYLFFRHNNSVIGTLFLVLCTMLAWIFFRMESPGWQLVKAHQYYWFPQILRQNPRSGDIFRYLFQSLWLLFVLPSRRRHKIFNVSHVFTKGLAFYYSLIASVPEKIKISKAAQRTAEQFTYAPNIVRHLLFILCSIVAIILMVICITQPFEPFAQFIFVLFLWGMAMSIRQAPGNVSTILLVVLSFIVSSRYLWWRYAYTLVWDDTVSAVFGSLLIFAETYIWLVMVLGYFQTIKPLHRQPVPLPEDSATWPTVDVMIVTYNEDLGIVKPGVYSALGLDWPKDKLNIYLLDDGNRPEFKKFAEEVGVHYIARTKHDHAKAGNVNHALQYTQGELVAIFDCDYVITSPFLQLTVGWFLKDPKLAILQTPHHFFSPDPFERNLKSFRKTPNESALFYGVIQDGNDTWNATYFCGSSGIIRRSALEKIGGLAVESVTEDAHTSLRLQRLGYNSAYIRIPLAAGLATESLASHVGQRIRWARGMVQILRMDNPLFGKGLALGQRLCYFNAMLHFLSGIPRLIFFITPAAFLIFHAYIVYASGVMILLYAIPHIVHAVLTNNRIQGKYRHFLWNEIYETVMAWYIAIPTTMALINPRKGKFNVTAKGELIADQYVDWAIARPYVVLLCINVAGLIFAFMRMVVDPSAPILALVITILWTLYNMIILGGALGVSIEAKQTRKAPRIAFVMPATIKKENGELIRCIVRNYSDRGVGIQTETQSLVQDGEKITLILQHKEKEFLFPGLVTHAEKNKIGVFLKDLNLQENIDFIQCTFARPEIWISWQEEFAQDKPLQSMRNVFTLDLRGYLDIIKYTPPKIRNLLIYLTNTIIWLGTFVPRKPSLRKSREFKLKYN